MQLTSRLRQQQKNVDLHYSVLFLKNNELRYSLLQTTAVAERNKGSKFYVWPNSEIFFKWLKYSRLQTAEEFFLVYALFELSDSRWTHLKHNIDIKKNERGLHNLLGRSTKSVLHLPPYDDELYDPMVLPRPNILDEVHVLFAIIQFHNYWFFLYDHALLGGLGFLGHLGEINGGSCIGKGGARIQYPGHEA